MDNTQEVIPLEQQLKQNLGTRSVKSLPLPKFPDADLAVRAKGVRRPPYKTDVLLVNPPTPDKAIWIRSQHRALHNCRGSNHLQERKKWLDYVFDQTQR